MTTSSESLVSQLRAATNQLHRELDDALSLQPGQITRQKYVDFLRGSLTALEPLESLLGPWSSADTPSRSQLLRSDLATLAAPTSVSSLREIPDITSEAAAFGVRYVIEGSALGGAILSRSFEAALGLQGAALSYLTLYGAALSEHWRGFLSELEQFGRAATPEMRSEACEAARAVFKLYTAGLRSTGAIAASNE